MRAFDIPSPRLRALATGESVVLPDAGDLSAGDRVLMTDDGPDRLALKPAYRRWDGVPVDGAWRGEVVEAADATDFDPDAFSSRHVLAGHPDGRVAVVRVASDRGPVLSDAAFEARRRSVDGARR